jgi:hypothetical protein
MNSENLAEIYLAENKIVSLLSVASLMKNAGGKYEGKSGDVIENKYRKNVRKPVSRDVYEIK